MRLRLYFLLMVLLAVPWTCAAQTVEVSIRSESGSERLGEMAVVEFGRLREVEVTTSGLVYTLHLTSVAVETSAAGEELVSVAVYVGEPVDADWISNFAGSQVLPKNSNAVKGLVLGATRGAEKVVWFRTFLSKSSEIQTLLRNIVGAMDKDILTPARAQMRMARKIPI